MLLRREVLVGGVLAGLTGLARPDEAAGLPSLLDALPATVQAAVRAGTYAGDLTLALREVIETGADFAVPPGIYPFGGDMLELRRAGQVIRGTGGIFRRRPGQDGVGMLVSASGVALHGLRFEGGAPARQPSHRNDMLVVTGNDCRLVQLSVAGSQGSNLRIQSARRVRVERPVLTDAYQNNLIICDGGTDEVTVEEPVCRRTATQNNIFVTASQASTDNGQTISRVRILSPSCWDAADTAIELGYHCMDCEVTGGEAGRSRNPALLQRDGRRNTWRDIRVVPLPLAAQHSAADAVAAVPQWEGDRWDSQSEFRRVRVLGQVARSAFFWGQSGFRRVDCDALAFGEGQSGRATSLVGRGDAKSGDVEGIVVTGGRIDGFTIGDDWNFDGRARVRRNCRTTNVQMTRCQRLFNLWNVQPVRCAITRNAGKGNGDVELELQLARLRPDAGEPDTGLVYHDNAFNAGERPLAVNLPQGENSPASVLLAANSRFVSLGGQILLSTKPRPGRYTIFLATGPWSFDVSSVGHRLTSMGQSGNSAVNNQGVTAELRNGRLFLVCTAPTGRPTWVKVSGPGLAAAPQPTS